MQWKNPSQIAQAMILQLYLETSMHKLDRRSNEGRWKADTVFMKKVMIIYYGL
jgi:hypothetical protein